MSFGEITLENIDAKVKANKPEITRILLKYQNGKDLTQFEARTLAGLVCAYAVASKTISETAQKNGSFIDFKTKEEAVSFTVQLINSMAIAGIPELNQDES